MPTETFPNVEPVRPSYTWEIRIVFPQAYWNAEQLADGEIETDIRASIHGELIAQLRTDTAGIEREDPTTLVLKMTELQTVPIRSSIITFDFVHELNGRRRAIIGRWVWPVVETVTRIYG